jgi:hypothetical protein
VRVGPEENHVRQTEARVPPECGLPRGCRPNKMPRRLVNADDGRQLLEDHLQNTVQRRRCHHAEGDLIRRPPLVEGLPVIAGSPRGKNGARSQIGYPTGVLIPVCRYLS